MFGILNINKPQGWTSRDVVNRVHRHVRPAKCGHAGTLDPLATGVLVVCIGPATRLIEYVQQLAKEYRATFLLGRSSASDDTETEVTELTHPPIPTLAQIEDTLPQFLGWIEQIPPAYSAVKIAGKRAYALARAGKSVDITPRPVDVYGIQITRYEYPQLDLTIRCGSGTYVRSLGRDLAHSLGTEAVMSALCRTSIGPFHLKDAIGVDLEPEVIAKHLSPPRVAVEHLPPLTLTAEQINELRFGRAIPSSLESECAAFDDQGNLIALLEQKSPGLLKPHINFAPPA